METDAKPKKERLSLVPMLGKEGMMTGRRKDGKDYSVRADRHRYFFPNEWEIFINSFSDDEHQLYFSTLIYTGARAMEALHLKPKNFDWARETVTFNVTKGRAAKRNFYSMSKVRTFFVSKKYLRAVKSFINSNSIADDDYLFMNKKRLPLEYDSMKNTDKRKYYLKYEVAYHQMLKRHLRKVGIKDWWNFSLHNIRKTYCNWMRIFDLRSDELCYRTGHDMKTFMEHYGSAMIFNSQEKIAIMNFFGEVK
jgi:integrase